MFKNLITFVTFVWTKNVLDIGYFR